MPLPDPIRQALFWSAVVAFALAQLALIVTMLREQRTPAATRNRLGFGRGPELLMAAVPAALTTLLLVIVSRSVCATVP
jgi:hypothetical protein